ncbi:MAG: response regulator [Treponema sp.]|nr:response regulator [Treponema sp.]
MKLICVDDEKIILKSLVSKCKEIDFVDEVFSFSSGLKVLEFLDQNPDCIIDAVILDIDMPDITGLSLAKEIKKRNQFIEVIFVTSFSQYAIEAFKTRASGYLLKPINKEDLLEELENVQAKRNIDIISVGNKKPAGIYAQTFGNFDLIVNGNPVEFAWKKSKEVLAYLIDRGGSIVTRKELAAVIFDDREYSRSNQTYLSKIVMRLQKDLKAVNASDIFVKGKDSYSVNPRIITCDAWDFLNGIGKEKYHGEYMLQYSWAELSIAKFEN